MPFLFTSVILALIWWGVYWLLIGRHANLGNDRKFPRQLLMVVLTILSFLTVVFSLPISENSRNQLIGLIGLLISAILAFSSTTVVANLMAGVLLRITKPFRVGDFIRVQEHFGRVAERGLFDTEIQSETRELIALPNTYLITHPVSTIRSSGTIISATLSLGYDVHHTRIEMLLADAAKESGLADPFVHILELGNYAVTYRVSGFLSEVKGVITARSKLSQYILDALHGQDIEIMSPSFMNQRRLEEGKKIIPATVSMGLPEPPEKEVLAEKIAFDKAELAEQIEKEKENIAEIEKTLKEIGDEQKKERMGKNLETRRERLKTMEEMCVEENKEIRIKELFR